MKISLTRRECAAAVAKTYSPEGCSAMVTWVYDHDAGELVGAELMLGPLVEGAPEAEDVISQRVDKA